MSRADHEPKIDSIAFYQALLRSERLRILIVITFVTTFSGAMAIRIFLYGSAMSRWGIIASFLLVAYEVAVLCAVNQSLKQGNDLSTAIWWSTILLESSFPAVGIAFFASTRLETAYRPLATPWVLAFFPLIILSTLRLNPWISRLAGLVASASYLAAAFYQGCGLV